MNDVNFEDIIVALSLYRPGPMKMIPQYINCKNGFSEPEYLFPELKEVLETTYGIIVYQEQVIQIATKLAGYSEGDADLFRRAIGKKDEELIKEQIDVLINGQEENLPKKKYISGLVRNGIPKDRAEELGQDIVSFSAYAFNRSHSAGYAFITMQTAFLKYYYPLEYMTSLISSYIQKSDDKITQYMDEAKRMGIKVLPPDVNMSGFEFIIEGDAIRFGLGAIKGMSKSAIAIVKEREKGRFQSIPDFLSRFGSSSVNLKTVDALIFSGAFDELSGGEDRKTILDTVYDIRGSKYESIDQILEKYVGKSEAGKAKQMYTKAFENESKITMDFLQAEKAFLGSYLSMHPLDGKAEDIDWSFVNPGDTLDVTGIIKKVKTTITKKGDTMCFVLIETINGDKDVTVFPNLYETCVNKLDPGGIRTFTLKVERHYKDPTELSFIARNIKYYRGDIVNDNNENENIEERRGSPYEEVLPV